MFVISNFAVLNPLLVTWRFNSLLGLANKVSLNICYERVLWLERMEGKEPHDFDGLRNNSVFSCIIFGMVGVWLAMNGSIAATSASTKILTQAPFWGFFGGWKCAGFWRKSNQISIVRGGWCLRYLGWRDKKMQQFFESGILFGSNEAAGWTDEAEGWTNEAEGWTRQIKTLFPLVTTNMAIFWDLPIEDGPNSRQLR